MEKGTAMRDYNEDELVKFETALLLEQAGFDRECIYTCTYTDITHHSDPQQWGGVKRKGLQLNGMKTVLVPTQTAAMKWLRETHYPRLSVRYDDENHLCWVVDGCILDVDDVPPFDTFESCTEYAIAECAKSIIKSNIEHNESTEV